jgi:hypothetical protein
MEMIVDLDSEGDISECDQSDSSMCDSEVNFPSKGIQAASTNEQELGVSKTA